MVKLTNGHLRTWIEIDRRALARNYRAFRQLIGPKVKLMAIAKSNAYGHNLLDFSRTLVKLGVDWLGVDSIVEATALRRAGLKANILVLGYTQPVNFPRAARRRITLTISSLESLKQLLILSLPPQFHLKIDTGMHRQGFLLPELARAVALIARAKLRAQRALTGVYSHLAAASNSASSDTVSRQITAFEVALATLAAGGWPRKTLIKHLAATGGAIGYPAARYDLIRIGLGLYGLWPSPVWRRRFQNKIKLAPPLIWKTIVSEVKTLPDGGAIGYDFTESVKAGTKIAVCPIGYWHGYPRFLSGVGRVRIKNHFAKVLGRVSMDMIVIEVTKIKNLEVGDEVVLLDGRKGSTAEELASLTQTSSYEIITRLNPLIQRFYI